MGFSILKFSLFFVIATIFAISLSSVAIRVGVKMAGGDAPAKRHGGGGGGALDGFFPAGPVMAAVVVSLLTWGLTAFSVLLLGYGNVFGWVVGLFISFPILKFSLHLPWGRGVVTWGLNCLAQVIVLVVALILVINRVVVFVG